MFSFSHLLERGNTAPQHPPDSNPQPFQHRALPQATKHVPSPLDEQTRVQEFERRLRYAMEQSLVLQAEQMSELDSFERDLRRAREESMVSHLLYQTKKEPIGSNRKPIKGILKKPRE